MHIFDIDLFYLFYFIATVTGICKGGYRNDQEIWQGFQVRNHKILP